MVDTSEKGWKKALTSILEQLGKKEYKKLLEYLHKLPGSMKETSREKMPGAIIKHYGLQKSISAINKAVDEIPRKDEAVQNLLRPYVDWLKTQEEKENQGKKRKLSEVEEEERTPVEKRKLTELKQGQRSVAGEQKRDGVEDEEESLTKKTMTLLGVQAPPMSRQTAEEKIRRPWEVSISELKSKDQLLETEVFLGKVIQKSALRRYQKEDGEKKFFFYLGVADETASVKVMIYKKELHKDIKEGRSYSFRNVIKDQNVVKVTKQSTKAEIKSVQVPEELEMEALKLIYPESEFYTIDEAKRCPDKTVMSVKGTVEEIAPVGDTKVSYQEKKKKTQRLKLKDETDSIWICMWGEETKLCRDLSLGDVVQMINVKTNDYHGNITLNSTSYTKIQQVETLGVQKVKIEIIGIIKATKKTTHLEAEFNQQVHTFVVGSPLLMKELDIKPGRGLQESLVDKVPFIADAEIKGNRITKIKVVSMM